VLFILSLRGFVSPPHPARHLFGMIGMAIATTLAVHRRRTASLGAGYPHRHRRQYRRSDYQVPMISMPELVAAFHSLVGMATRWWPPARSTRPRPSTSAPGAIHGASWLKCLRRRHRR
jgi:NAD/NADP transhydrogenase beta subunit